MINKDNPQAGVPLETRDIGIKGMTCDHCVKQVEKVLRGKPGVRAVKVDRAAARATVTFDRTQTDLAGLHEALLASGYNPVGIPA